MKNLSPAEWENLKNGAKYIASIVLTVVVTFVIVATIAGYFGYTPPTPSSPEASPEATSLPQAD
jgi:hypothetical protein